MSDEGIEKIKIHPVSVEEAKSRIDRVKSILDDLQEIYERYKEEEELLAILSREEDPQDVAKQRFKVDQIQAQVIEYRKELLDLDCVLKDFQSGLVDFVAIREGEPVWLCYQRGEDSLRYFHGWKAGFKGREPIDFD